NECTDTRWQRPLPGKRAGIQLRIAATEINSLGSCRQPPVGYGTEGFQLRSRACQRFQIVRIVKAKSLIARHGNGNFFAPCFSNLSRRQADSDAGLSKQTIQIDVILDQTRKPADESFIKYILLRDRQPAT